MDNDLAFEARSLLRAARVGTLATQFEGQPFAGLVTPATDAGGAVLLLLSDLSEHTRHLRAPLPDGGLCAVMIAGPPIDANPQTAPRLTVRGRATITTDPGARVRWLAAHPYAAFYADFGDFNLWRIEVTDASYVGGFARAFRLGASDLATASEAVEAAADDIMSHCNDHHRDTLDLLAGASPGWAMVAVDVDGCDLSNGEVCRRVAWPAPVGDAAGVRAALITLARAARL